MQPRRFYRFWYSRSIGVCGRRKQNGAVKKMLIASLIFVMSFAAMMNFAALSWRSGLLRVAGQPLAYESELVADLSRKALNTGSFQDVRAYQKLCPNLRGDGGSGPTLRAVSAYYRVSSCRLPAAWANPLRTGRRARWPTARASRPSSCRSAWRVPKSWPPNSLRTNHRRPAHRLSCSAPPDRSLPLISSPDFCPARLPHTLCPVGISSQVRPILWSKW